MVQDPYTRGKKIDGAAVANTVVGTLVLTFGVGVSLWILSLLGQMIGGEHPVPLVERIAAAVGDGNAAFWPGGQPDNRTVTTVAGYLIAVFLLSIGAGLAKALIGAGAKIMNPDYKKVLGELKKQLQKGSPPR